MKKTISILITLALIVGLVGCSNKPQEPIEIEAFALDTVIGIKIWDDDKSILDGAVEIVKNYDKMFSKSVEQSDVYKMNHSNGQAVQVTDDTIFLLEKGIEYGNMSNGYFDITILGLKDLWDFKSDSPKVPSSEDINEKLKSVDYKNIVINGNEVKLLNGAQVDFGSIAKGYIADKVSYYLVENGVKKAIINLGGNILTVGEKELGLPWTIGIQHPDLNRNETLATVKVKDKSVVTSGVYERFFNENGKLYHHLLDPYTGYPANNGIMSVTIISDKSVDGDSLSTTCFVLGLEKGMELVESLDGIEVVYVMDGMEIVKSSGVDDMGFQLTN